MLDTLYVQLFSLKITENIWLIFGSFFLVISSFFFWKQWKMVRGYRHLPSKRADVEWVLRGILGKYPKDMSITRLLFQTLLNMAKEFLQEGLCVVWIFSPYVFIFSEKYMKDLVNEVDFVDKGLGFNINKKMFGNGLVAVDLEEWKFQRKLLNPAFSAGALKLKMHTLKKYARLLAKNLEGLVGKPGNEAYNHIKLCTFQNMTDYVLGLDINVERKDLMHFFMEIVEEAAVQFTVKFVCPWLHWDFMLPLFPAGRKYLKIIDAINGKIEEVIDELKKKQIESDRGHTDEKSQKFVTVGDILMKLYLKDKVISKKDVRDQLVTFTAASYETVSVTMLWCFYTLGHHPEVQEKAYRELQSIVPDGDLTYEDLAKLNYLDCVIKETMRLYSIAAVFDRKARNDLQCGPYTIPKGSTVVAFPFIMHRDPNVFPEPEKFIPERFLDCSNVRPWMYIPFGEGYRYCIGKRFALMQMKVNLAHVIRSVQITSLTKIDDSQLDWSITMRPAKPLEFSFEKRLSNV